MIELFYVQRVTGYASECMAFRDKESVSRSRIGRGKFYSNVSVETNDNIVIANSTFVVESKQLRHNNYNSLPSSLITM